MNRTKVLKKSGFTLIELLLVVAVIGLLASIILSALNDARDKAKNSAKVQLVEQYVNALELYKSDTKDNTYPDVGRSNDLYCLGEVNGTDKCQYNEPGSSQLISDLEDYIPNVPRSDTPVSFYGRDYKGLAYGCDRNSASDSCNEFILVWYLVDTDSCNFRNSIASTLSPHVKCIYYSKSDI